MALQGRGDEQGGEKIRKWGGVLKRGGKGSEKRWQKDRNEETGSVKMGRGRMSKFLEGKRSLDEESYSCYACHVFR